MENKTDYIGSQQQWEDSINADYERKEREVEEYNNNMHKEYYKSMENKTNLPEVVELLKEASSILWDNSGGSKYEYELTTAGSSIDDIIKELVKIINHGKQDAGSQDIFRT